MPDAVIFGNNMIQKKVAEETKEVVLACVGQLDRSIAEAFKGAPERQASLYRSLAGKVMGLLFTEILVPIYAAFPELEPEDLKQVRAEEVRFIPLEVGLKLMETHSTVEDTLAKLREQLAQSNDSDDVKRLVLALDDLAEPLKTIKEYLRRSCPGIEGAYRNEP
jgi:hypothetical protein